MKILLTGATGYIGKRLLPVLLDQGHMVVCCVRDKERFTYPESFSSQIEVVEVDFLDENTLDNIPKDIEAAYYLIHSMSTSRNYMELELRSSGNFRKAVDGSQLKHLVYLSGIINEDELSQHLASRKAVEEDLSKGNYHFTTLRAGIIIGSGSASFEIIRDLAEKLPLMVTPKWLNTRCQPIGVKDVISFLERSLMNEKTFDKNFDIGGPDILTYKEMLEGYAKARGLKRWIFTVPVMTPRLSSYWLYFITSTSYRLAVALVNSMKIEVICRNNDVNAILEIQPLTYQQALERTLSAINRDQIVSSWKDSAVSGRFDSKLADFIEVPTFGCFIDKRIKGVNNKERSLDRIWSIGGSNGWYFANVLWRIRGVMDKLLGGVGLRRGRTHLNSINSGDVIDFWRVLYANKQDGRLLLFAEMRLPGEAWLEFKLKNGVLTQTATFRPKGILGRLYWYSVLPFHGLVFQGMINALTR